MAARRRSAALFALLQDPSRVRANLAERVFEARLKSYAAAWPASGGRPVASNPPPAAAPQPAAAAGPARAEQPLLSIRVLDSAGQHHDRRTGRAAAAA